MSVILMTTLFYKALISQGEIWYWSLLGLKGLIETFRFKDEDDYEYEIWLQVYTPRKASFYHFSLEKLALLPLVKEVTPSPDRKIIKLLTFDNLFSHFNILAKTRTGVTTATTFSCQNDPGSRASAI